MPLLNWFSPYSDSWHVYVNSDIKITMHEMDMRSMGVHDTVAHEAVHSVVMRSVAGRRVAVRNISVYCVSLTGIDVPGVGIHKTRNFFSDIKLIFDDHLRKNCNFFLLNVAE
jgi:hypothetical protein